MKTKKQPYYDKQHFNKSIKPVGDEMTAVEIAAWIVILGATLGSLIYLGLLQ